MTFIFTLLGLIGGPEMILIGLVVVIIFGGKRIPELMKGLGSGIREFKKASEGNEIAKDIKDISSEIKQAGNEIKNISSPLKSIGKETKTK